MFFQNEAEASAWATFFAAQSTSVFNEPKKNQDKAIEDAAERADKMLDAWRGRAYPQAQEEPTDLEVTEDPTA